MVPDQVLGWYFRRAAHALVDGRRLRTRWIASPIGNLLAHEEGGHTIAQHVAVPLENLVQRTIEDDVRAASSFWNAPVATAAINPDLKIIQAARACSTRV